MERGVRRYGVVGVARTLLERVRERLRTRLHLLETHVLYQIELTEDCPPHALPEGFRLMRATSEDLGVCETFGWVSRAEAEKRHRDGATLWLVRDDEDHTVFCCWTFNDHLPVFAAKGASLPLRKGTVALENSYAAPEHRGRHLGPTAVCEVMRRLFEDDFDHLLTKVEEPDQRTRHAAIRAGFREVAIMCTSRLLWFQPRVEICALSGREQPFLDRQPSAAGGRQASPDAPVNDGRRQPSHVPEQSSNGHASSNGHGASRRDSELSYIG